MKMKKIVVLLAAVFAVFAFTSTAMAQDRVEVKVTSEPIGYQVLCDKAGGFSLEFDQNTQITDGDQITLDLSWLAPQDYVTICKAIDFEISPAGSTSGWTFLTIPYGAPNSSYAFYWAGGAAPTNGVGSVYFRVYGDVGTQRITIDVVGVAAGDYVEVGNAPDARIILAFFDQQTNADFDASGIWVESTVAGTYDTPASFADNTLCINTTLYSASTVKANLDSRNDKYTFIPSDPQIAHVAAQTTYSIVECGGKAAANPGRTICGQQGEVNGTDSCQYFDYETGEGYYASTRQGNNRLLIRSLDPFEDRYELRLEILVDGEGGDNGVYFSNQILEYKAYDTATNSAACLEPITFANDANLIDITGTYTYKNAVGGAVTAAAPQVANCDIATANRAVYLQSPVFAPAGDMRLMLVDIPAFNYDLTMVGAGQGVVSVKITLIKSPCGEKEVGTKVVATLCAATPVVGPTYAKTIVFPYFTAPNDANWWSGIVITNLSGMDGNFTAIGYEQDGDVWAFTGTVDANTVYQSGLSAALSGATLVTTGTGAGAGTIGDSQCYVLVCHDFVADGFAMIGTKGTYAFHEGMGYIPRVDYDDGTISFCNTMMITAGSLP